MNSAVVLFSGGVDSTYVVFKSAPSHERLHLITYRVPGMINVDFSRRSARQLIRFYGSKISHEVIDIRGFVYSLRGNVSRCIKDNVKYGFYCSWCLGCRIAMHLATVTYCRENNISVVLEGSNFYDRESLAQHEEILELLKEAYKDAGVILTAPYYYEENVVFSRGWAASFLRKVRFFKDGTSFRRRYLSERGIDMGFGFISQYRTTQPSCLSSLLFNSAKALLTVVRKESRAGYLKYAEDTIRRFSRANIKKP